LFCAIAGKTSAGAIVYEDEVCSAFLDIKPLFLGHTLVVPKQHVATLPELDRELILPFFSAVQRLSAAIPRALAAQGTFVAMNNVVSQSVPHLHVHVVARTKGDGLKGFFWPRTKYKSAADLERVRSAIAAAL
jgi:histidine triad (HIT) family protein